MRALVFAALAAVVVTSTIEIEEWPVPWERTRPRDPYVAPDGRVWFVGQTADYAGVFDPKSREFHRFPLPDGAGPHTLIVDAAGIVWYAGNRAAHIGRLDPATGAIKQFPTPDGVQDPHTLVFDGKGGIWFTAQQSNAVGHFDPRSGAMRVLQVPTPGARPYGIVVAPDGRPWIVLFGTNKLATVDPQAFTLREIALPREGARPRRLVVTSDGTVWYGDYAGGHLGRYEPATGAFREWPLPGGTGSLPYAMAVDGEDRIWLVETGLRPNRFVMFDPRTSAFGDPTPIPSGAGSVRHMMFHAATRTIWFGTDANTIGRARLTD
jgi:virginiamycin B lyase